MSQNLGTEPSSALRRLFSRGGIAILLLLCTVGWLAKRIWINETISPPAKPASAMNEKPTSIIDESKQHLMLHFDGIQFPSRDAVSERAAILKKEFPGWKMADFFAEIIPDKTFESNDKMLLFFGLEKFRFINSIPEYATLKKHDLIAFTSDSGGDLYCVKSKEDGLKVYRVYFPSLYDGQLEEYLREFNIFPRFMDAYLENKERIRRIKQGYKEK